MIDKAKLEDRIAEEYKDADAYDAMASECPEWGQIFCDIAHEEREHAKMLEHICIKMA